MNGQVYGYNMYKVITITNSLKHFEDTYKRIIHEFQTYSSFTKAMLEKNWKNIRFHNIPRHISISC